jgi:hypothetical protein
VAGPFRARSVERLEDALALRRGDARAAIHDTDDDALPDGPRTERDGMPARVARGVLQDVREGTLELRRVRAHEGQVALDRDVERARRQGEVVDRRLQHLVDRARLGARLGGVGLQAREIEQVLDEARQPLRLLLDAARELAALPVLDVVGRQRLRRRHDRGDRRPQVVADGPQQRGLDDVAAPQRPRLDDVAEQLVALLRRGEQRLELRHCPLLRAPEHVLRQAGGQEQRADLHGVLAQGERDPAIVALDGTQLDRRRRETQRAREALRGDGEDGRQVLPAEQQPRELRGEVGLPAALLGLLGAVTRRLRERARDERDDAEHREGHPVLRLGDREAARRRQVEPVEGEPPEDRGDGAEDRPPADRHQEDRDEVDHDERRDGRDLLQREEDQGGERDAHDRGDEPQPRAGPAVAREAERVASGHKGSVDPPGSSSHDLETAPDRASWTT